MRPPRLIRGAVGLAVVLALEALASTAAGGGERTLFKDIPSTDPARQVIETVLGSRFYSLRDVFPAADWSGLGYGAAWERARRYFPAAAYYVWPGTYFMAHGFDADGRLFMEIHESAYLRLCVANWRAFAPGSAVAEHARMLAEPDGREAADFRQKTGRLEPFFRSQPALAAFRKALGPELYGRFLGRLREEDYHMLAGGLMHEGMHAGLDDAIVARIQAEFGDGRRAVQWDELRAFMAEVGYHGAFCRSAANGLASDWRQIEDRLGDLEKLRKVKELGPGGARTRFERARVQASAFAALVRLGMRELWQSARRRQALAASFRQDYVRGPVPPVIDGLLVKLESDAAGFAGAAGAAIQEAELSVRALEEVLETWEDWAAGNRPFPPPVTDSRAVIERVKGVRWPDPAGDAAVALMKMAAEALEKEREPA